MNLPPPDAPICSSGKHPFRTEGEASKNLRSAQYLRNNSHTGYRPGSVEAAVYQCPVCSWFHLTSSKRPRRRSDFQGRDQRRKKR